MIFRAPFYAVTKAVYSALKAMPDGLEWFDSSVPIPEIEDFFKAQPEFAYGIFGASTADCMPNKDIAVWQCSLNLDIYSNYKGRKAISIQLEKLLNYFSTQEGWDAIQTALGAEGFSMIDIRVGALSINPPIYAELGVWQSGSTQLNFRVQQHTN